jgi:tetratricopeptide (TPR) repeat protein
LAKVVLHHILRALEVQTEEAMEAISQAVKTGAEAAVRVIKKLQPPLPTSPERRWFERFCVLLDGHFFAHYREKSTTPVFTSPSVAWAHVVNGSLVQRPVFADLLDLCNGRAHATDALLLVIEGGSSCGKTGVLKWLAHGLSLQNHLVLEVVNADPLLRLEVLNAQETRPFHCFLFMDEPFLDVGPPAFFDWESFPAAVTLVVSSKPDEWRNIKIKGFDIRTIQLPITPEDVAAVLSHPVLAAESCERDTTLAHQLTKAPTYRELVFQVYTGRLFRDTLFSAATTASDRERNLLFTAAVFAEMSLAIPRALFERIAEVSNLAAAVSESATLTELMHRNEMLPFETWQMKETDSAVLLPALLQQGMDPVRLLAAVPTYMEPASKPDRLLLLHVLRRLAQRSKMGIATSIVRSDDFVRSQSDIALAGGAAELLKGWNPILKKLGSSDLAAAWSQIALQKLPETTSDCLAQIGCLVELRRFRDARDAAARWIERYPDEPIVRAEYVSLVRKSKHLTTINRVASETSSWIAHHPTDQLVRVAWLALVRQWSNLATVRGAIADANRFLVDNPSASETLWGACLSLIGDFGTVVQKECAVALGHTHLQKVSRTQSFWCPYLSLLRGYHDEQLLDSVLERLQASEDGQIRLAMAQLRLARGQKDRVNEEVETVLRARPSDFAARMLKARLLMLDSQFLPARDLLEQIMAEAAKRYKAGIFRRLAEAEEGLGNYHEAANCFSQAVDLSCFAARPWMLNARGLFYARQRVYDKAEADFKSTRSGDPDFFWGDFNLGALYAKLGRDGSDELFRCALSKVTADSKYVSSPRLLSYIDRAQTGDWPPRILA